MTDIRDELHASVDEVVSQKESDDAREARLAALEAREMPTVDISPINAAIESLNGKFDALVATMTARSASTEVAATESASPDTSSDDDDDESDDETAPRVVTQMTTKEEIDEKPPRPAHFLFRRFGR